MRLKRDSQRHRKKERKEEEREGGRQGGRERKADRQTHSGDRQATAGSPLCPAVPVLSAEKSQDG